MLTACLQSILRHRTGVAYEIVVVDNHPASGQSHFAAGWHEKVRYVAEENQGLAYARNAGFRAASGEILVCTDDDVEVPDYWLDRIVRHFQRPEVKAVTGNVIPYKQETEAEILFERYGGLGRGPKQREFDERWLRRRKRFPPTWDIGATANASFHRSILEHPDIGYMVEYLGPGTPAGVGEDTELFYRIIKAGFTIVYDPEAFLYHKHRESMEAFKRQFYNYSKGHYAYLLYTLLRYGDRRVLKRMFWTIPRWHIRRLLGLEDPFPKDLVLLEMLANWLGPTALLQAWLTWKVRHRRVRVH